MSEIIRLENVVKVTPSNRRAVNGVNLRISQGERVTICGAPGSGKETLMRLIAGMEKPSDGKIFVCGQAVHDMDAGSAAAFRNRIFGILHRNPAFVDTLTLSENVAMPLCIRGLPAAKRDKAVRDTLKSFGLLYAKDALPEKLSALEIHMAAVARALIAKPQILMLHDAGADLSQRENEQIKAALPDSGAYTIVELTGAENAMIGADRIIKLEFGRIQEEVQ